VPGFKGLAHDSASYSTGSATVPAYSWYTYDVTVPSGEVWLITGGGLMTGDYTGHIVRVYHLKTTTTGAVMQTGVNWPHAMATYVPCPAGQGIRIYIYNGYTGSLTTYYGYSYLKLV